jgi:hypothetical protein
MTKERQSRLMTGGDPASPPAQLDPDIAATWPTKSELRCAYYGRNKARIFNGAIDSANLKKFTLNQLHLLAK